MSNELNGWESAGLIVVRLLASRKEVTASGIVDGIKQLIEALDKKEKCPPEKVKQVMSENRALKRQVVTLTEELAGMKTKRELAAGAACLMHDLSITQIKQTKRMGRLLSIAKGGIGGRRIELCKEDAERALNDRARNQQ